MRKHVTISEPAYCRLNDLSQRYCRFEDSNKGNKKEFLSRLLSKITKKEVERILKRSEK